MPELLSAEIDLSQFQWEVSNNQLRKFCTLPVETCSKLVVIVRLVAKFL